MKKVAGIIETQRVRSDPDCPIVKEETKRYTIRGEVRRQIRCFVSDRLVVRWAADGVSGLSQHTHSR